MPSLECKEMTRKVDRADDWIPASAAARILSEKCSCYVNPQYITKLAQSKKQPVRTRPVSGHKLYNQQDIMACTIKQRKPRHP